MHGDALPHLGGIASAAVGALRSNSPDWTLCVLQLANFRQWNLPRVAADVVTLVRLIW